MARTPIPKILDTIAEVARIQDQLGLIETAIEKLASRVEAIEKAATKNAPTSGRA